MSALKVHNTGLGKKGSGNNMAKKKGSWRRTDKGIEMYEKYKRLYHHTVPLIKQAYKEISEDEYSPGMENIKRQLSYSALGKTQRKNFSYKQLNMFKTMTDLNNEIQKLQQIGGSEYVDEDGWYQYTDPLKTITREGLDTYKSNKLKAFRETFLKDVDFDDYEEGALFKILDTDFVGLGGVEREYSSDMIEDMVMFMNVTQEEMSTDARVRAVQKALQTYGNTRKGTFAEHLYFAVQEELRDREDLLERILDHDE